MRVSGLDGGAQTRIKTLKEVTFKVYGNERIIKHKLRLLNLAKELRVRYKPLNVKNKMMRPLGK